MLQLPTSRALSVALMNYTAPAGVSSLLTSLVAYWKLDEASGSRADSAGANTLTDTNTVTQATGKISSAAQFTAANSESLLRADNAALSSGDVDFSISAWVYIDSKGTNRTVVSKYTSGFTGEYMIRFDNGADRFTFLVSNGATDLKTATANNLGSPALATWYFIVAWHNAAADTVNIQVNNGTVDSTATLGVAPVDGALAFAIGARSGTPDVFFDGRIDEVGFWKRVLTAAERTSLYNSGAGITHPFTGA